MDDRDARLQEVARIAVALQAQTGCPAQLLIAQWAVESQWGAKPSPLHWEYQLLRRASLPDQSPANAKYKLAIAVWKRLPLPVANRLGPRVIRQFPG